MNRDRTPVPTAAEQRCTSSTAERRSQARARHRTRALLLLALGAGLLLPAPHERGDARAADGNRDHVVVTLNQSRVIKLKSPAARVSVANPEIADILVLDPRQLYAVGKRLGTTNVVLWDANDRVRGTIGLEVTPDLELLKTRLYQLMPNEQVEVRAAQGTIVVSGEVSSPDKAEAAMQLAQSFAQSDSAGEPAQVLNMVQVGGSQQVMLEVTVAEISRNLVKRLDVNFTSFYNGGSFKFGTVGGGATFPDAIFKDPVLGDVRLPQFADQGMWGPAVPEFAPNNPSIQDQGLFAQSLSGNFLFRAVIDAAKDEGLAKILAEPNLTTLSGQQAQFLAGGEFPIPVPQDFGRTTIEYKEFGVGLLFVPYVLDSGVISLKVNVTVSDLASQNSLSLPTAANAGGANYFVPALTKRSANATVEVTTGETIAIAGLINETLRENVNKFPGLGDLPIVGALFRSQEFVKGQTELVIFVTPKLARSFSPDLVQLPTDSFVEPTDREFYLMGKLEGSRNRGMGGGLGPDKAGSEGPFGHDL